MSTSCPKPEAICRMLAGCGDITPEPELLQHLEHCDACRDHLEAMFGAGSGDGCASLLSGPPTPAGLRAVLEAVKAIGPSVPESPVGGWEVPDELASMRSVGPYEILATAGSGGMGVVFQAWDSDLQRPVALKILHPTLAAIPRARARFLAEARALAAVVHPHVVTIHGVGDADGHPYLVMEWIAGASLRERILAEGGLPMAQVVRIGAQAARGLAAIHARGLVHRDIKPANVLLVPGSGAVKIADFGLAGLLAGRPPADACCAGTPGYAAPEQLHGPEFDHRADLFSLGATLRAACVPACAPELPSAFATLLDMLLAEDPAGRPGSADTVAAVCDRLLAELDEEWTASWQEPPQRPD